ncbi:MAG: 30S ribosome-binding factor RbfA [Candidatus Hydrogenedentes bacterium]|nr:30S ribosome-binding factor RbfA [Candidatus Hydrogenedentota bacterium]
MTQSGRAQRVAELIRQEIARLLSKGLKDPRIGFVSVMSVRMSRDLKYADVFVSLFGEEKERKSSLIALQRSAGWIRRELGKVLRMRYTPEVRFLEDQTLDRVYQLEEVFHEIHEERKRAPMIKLSLVEIVEEFRKGNSFLVTSHVNPDGDSVGSILALEQLLRAMNKEKITCAMADPVPSVYANLKGAKKIIDCTAERPDFDVLIILDVSSLDRIGCVAQWVDEKVRIIVIDHHLVDNPEGTVGFIDPSYAAVGEIVAELFEVAGVPLTREAAHCAYVAQITDTSAYRFSNTNSRSHHLAARLLDTGLDVSAISREVLDIISVSKVKLLRLVLDRMEFRAQGKLAASYITAEDIAAAGGSKDDITGLVNYAGNIDGVQVGLLFNAHEPGKTKVSLRSRPSFNSAEFLEEFGGGGHAAAAGATLDSPLEEVQPMLLDRLEHLLEEESA